jgi:hypothetical protein
MVWFTDLPSRSPSSVSFKRHLRALNPLRGTVAASRVGLRQADASCGHGTTKDAATRADLEAFRVMSGRSHGIDRMTVVGPRFLGDQRWMDHAAVLTSGTRLRTRGGPSVQRCVNRGAVCSDNQA